MTTTPFEPHPEFGKPRIAAADPGPGAPEQAEGFGVQAEDSDHEHDVRPADDGD
ncbi:hypothetical protein [Saccharothrix syringae]|uniref:hypothetical protein n=1 Tax=Saccharothrix syringae TaxID=103733 RepID=UPI000AD5BBF7|nr:hypothetical protein [Saccharothrix syringae]